VPVEVPAGAHAVGLGAAPARYPAKNSTGGGNWLLIPLQQLDDPFKVMALKFCQLLERGHEPGQTVTVIEKQPPAPPKLPRLVA
jgi:hypothetical protein